VDVTEWFGDILEYEHRNMNTGGHDEESEQWGGCESTEAV